MAKSQRTKAPSSAINKDQDAALRELAGAVIELGHALREGEGGGRRMHAERAVVHAYTALEYLDTAAVGRELVAEGDSGDGSLHDDQA